MFTWKYGPMFSPEDGKSGGENGDNGDNGDDGGNGGKGNKSTLTFDAWLESQDEQVKNLLGDHTKGLKSALESERESRKDFEKQLREMAKKAEEGSEAQTQLTEMADKLAESDRKADFYEDAHAAGVTNLKLAFLVATQDELFDRKGQVNFKSMKETYPELFGGQIKPKGNAGNGTNNEQTPEKSMNTFIRRAAGREA